jgi:hypothetical protein
MMGRPKKKKEDHRVKFGISIDPKLFDLLSGESISKSKFIENIVKDYYEKKEIQ